MRLALVSSALMALVAPSGAFLPPVAPTTTASTSTALAAAPGSRADFVRTVVGGAAAAATAALAPLQVLAAEEVTTASGLKIKKLKSGKGAKCEIGDLAAIRFKGRYKEFEFDNIFDTDEPLFFRAGGGNLIKGIDEAVVMMKVGDRWELTIPGSLGFGDKGKPPSPGKPRIPPNAELLYEVELVGLPGKEGELFEAFDEGDFPSSSDDN